MKCLLYKTITVALALLVLGAGASDARAAFTDSEGHMAEFSVGILDFALMSDGAPIANNTFKFTGAGSASKSVSVATTGTLPFTYSVKLENISGNSEFCNSLQVSIGHGGSTVFGGALRTASTTESYGEGVEPWTIEYVETGTFSESRLCVFDVVFAGRQARVSGDVGFTKDRTVTLVIANTPKTTGTAVLEAMSVNASREEEKKTDIKTETVNSTDTDGVASEETDTSKEVVADAVANGATESSLGGQSEQNSSLGEGEGGTVVEGNSSSLPTGGGIAGEGVGVTVTDMVTIIPLPAEAPQPVVLTTVAAIEDDTSTGTVPNATDGGVVTPDVDKGQNDAVAPTVPTTETTPPSVPLESSAHDVGPAPGGQGS